MKEIQEHRVLRPADIKRISDEVDVGKKLFLDRVANANHETTKFSTSVCNAIGDISVSEAIQGVIDFFIEKMHER